MGSIEDLIVWKIKNDFGERIDVKVPEYQFFGCSARDRECQLLAKIVINNVVVDDTGFVLSNGDSHINYLFEKPDHIRRSVFIIEQINRYFNEKAGGMVSLKTLNCSDATASFDVFGLKMEKVPIRCDMLSGFVYCDHLNGCIQRMVLRDHVLDVTGRTNDAALLKLFVTHMDPEYRQVVSEMFRIVSFKKSLEPMAFYDGLVKSYIRDDGDEMKIKLMTPIIDNMLFTIYEHDMMYFRNVDEINGLLPHHRWMYESLLLCHDEHNKTALCPSRRIAYYLRHKEPHFRNILFKLFHFEITSFLSLFEDSDLVRDVRVFIMMKYTMCLISSSVV